MLRKLFFVLVAALGVCACDSDTSIGLRDKDFQLTWDHLPSLELYRTLHKKKTADSLRVLWWNVEQGRETPRFGSHILDRNLKNIASSPLSPDLLILGEYLPSGLQESTVRRLERIYPHHHFVPYNGCFSEVGIWIGSKLPTGDLEVEDASWIPQGELLPKAYREKWMSRLAEVEPEGVDQCALDKPAVHVPVHWSSRQGDRTLSVFPVHLLMPWMIIKKETNLTNTLAEILQGEDHPLFHQAISIRSKIAPALERARSSAALLIGDFNVPASFGLSSKSFQAFTKGFSDLYDSDAPATFPTRISERYGSIPALKIDHALTLGSVRATFAEVLEVQGSDHYPLYFELTTF